MHNIKMTWENITKAMKNLSELKYKELQQAVHSSGSRRLADNYQHLRVSNVQWVTMSVEQSIAQMQKAQLANSDLEPET